MRPILWLVLPIGILASGCTHTQLRFNTTKQAQTVADVHTQQVLDNLAKFARDPHALPHFSYPIAGASAITDNLGGTAGINFANPITGSLNGTGSRNIQESYTMTPVNDPRKLELMRCAYQQAITSCGLGNQSGECPDCEKRINNFYLGDTNTTKTQDQTPNGNSISELNRDIKIAYFPNGTDHDFVEIHPVNSDKLRVFKDRNNHNKIIYRLYSEASDDNQRVVPIGSELYEVVEIGKSEDNESDPEMIRRGGKYFKKSDFNDAWQINQSEVNPQSDKVKAVLALALTSEDLSPVYVNGTVGNFSDTNGIVTTACIDGHCWFCCGDKHDAPNHNQCCYVGHHCGTYVWVPHHGRDALTNLTLIILDIALNDPPESPNSEVIAYVGTDGQTPATKDTASFEIKGNVRGGGNPTSLLPSSDTAAQSPGEIEIRKIRDKQLAAAQDEFREQANLVYVQLLGDERFSKLPESIKAIVPAVATDSELVTLAKISLVLEGEDGFEKLIEAAEALIKAQERVDVIESVSSSTPNNPGDQVPQPKGRPTSRGAPGSNILRLQQSLDTLGL